MKSFQIFYIQHVKNYHWVLQVAVNPWCMLSHVTNYALPEEINHLPYGFLYMDPMEKHYRDGSMPDQKSKTGAEDISQNRELIFLLNWLSFYRDMHCHDCQSFVETDEAYIMARGLSGPFGRVKLKNENFHNQDMQKYYPRFHYPQLKTPPKTLPVQTDGYNCVFFVILNILDLIYTQADKQWVLLNQDEASQDWFFSMVEERQAIVLPDKYGIGTAFVENPSQCQGKQYTSKIM